MPSGPTDATMFPPDVSSPEVPCNRYRNSASFLTCISTLGGDCCPHAARATAQHSASKRRTRVDRVILFHLAEWRLPFMITRLAPPGYRAPGLSDVGSEPAYRD